MINSSITDVEDKSVSVRVKRGMHQGVEYLIKELEDKFVSVLTNNMSGIHRTVKYLVKKRHKRIALILGPVLSAPPGVRLRIDIEKLEGYRLALERHGLDYDERLVKEASHYHKDRLALMIEELLSLEPRISAVLASDDVIATEIIKLLMMKGLRVPQDMAVVGYGDMYIATSLNPALTTVRVPMYEIGKIAAERLVAILNGEQISEPTLRIEPQLVIRESA